LTFWVKGDGKTGFSPKIKIELKNSKGEIGRYTLTSISKEWRQVSIPLKQFTGLADLTSMRELVIVFDDITCETKKKGTIYIDDIAFVK
ncbi:MAG: carbohydrate binding domain-containing protein, partial [Candidatus Omnitrophota bacterium]|nr:carbohydrate binding domain-containing protein [Candidatus Omnitrophota bacterium]